MAELSQMGNTYMRDLHYSRMGDVHALEPCAIAQTRTSS
jgi:hypothetical protein